MAIRNQILGETILPEEFATGVADPQQEISVILSGMGEAIDVTFRHSTACSDPFLIAVAFEARMPTSLELQGLSLKFYERDGERKLLGEIGLRLKVTISSMGSELFLFAPRYVYNYCLPKLLLGARYSLHLFRQWQDRTNSAITMTFLQRRAAMVSFIRPHPTVLVSIEDEFGGNIFPMNIIGALGDGRLGFALRSDRLAGQSVERAGRLVMSNVPVRHASLAYGMAGNHTRAFIKWDELPFKTKPSPMFRVPIPEFALRVREVELENIHRIGSHDFFVARVLRDTVCSSEPSLCVIHGNYQERRLRRDATRMKAALLEDRLNKRGDQTH